MELSKHNKLHTACSLLTVPSTSLIQTGNPALKSYRRLPLVTNGFRTRRLVLTSIFILTRHLFVLVFFPPLLKRTHVYRKDGRAIPIGSLVVGFIVVPASSHPVSLCNRAARSSSANFWQPWSIIINSWPVQRQASGRRVAQVMVTDFMPSVFPSSEI
ncbi:hypothetical protein B0T24DRAFT_431819 [Lasiosphaeria ovina]|uniref:Uncharacterized protein n=1 Tax=Lasiosphaeria ovina TaxID=92902 RepID=A0AAE0JWM6_9PEZI|nr:hypothetical protein B0T24DRAFT_431819 [Lasiosphaeria ovina]